MVNRAPWQNPRVLYTLICVFLSGALFGALAMRFTTSPHRHSSAAYWKEGGRKISIEKFKTELNLTPEQAKEIETVLDDFVMYTQTLQAQMDDVAATGKQRIVRILREDQRQKFEKMVGEMQSKQLLQ
jgi:hypothetical protein